MTKWKRLRRLRERQRAESEAIKPEAEVTVEITDPEPKLAERTSLGDPRKIKKSEQPTRTFNPKPILAQIPRYAYLLAIFALLAGIFFPLITPGVPFDHAIQGIATLSLGLVGGILLFKAATSDNRRGIFIAVGFALIAISLALIYHIQETVRSLYY
tara:strand:+ start:44 stop:514 length:471 start_codon:yes stop_codon:yes gene_type:complete